MTSQRSKVEAGDGVSVPAKSSIYFAWAEGRQVALVIEWDGNGYAERECWIQAGDDSFRNLADVE